MRTRFHRTRRRAAAAALEAVLLAAGISLLAYCVWTVGDARWFQSRESRWLQGRIEGGLDLDRALEATNRRGVLGRLEVPRLALSTVVVEGTEDESLRRAAGRVEGSALPGFDGNVAIAGHRDTHFRALREIREGDRIRVVTAYGEFGYEVVETEVVQPFRTDLLEGHGNRELTLVTCYPFRFIGKAPLRFVVRARETTRKFYS